MIGLLLAALAAAPGPDVDRVAEAIVRVSSSGAWVPRMFRREMGRIRARLYATILIEEAGAVGLGDVLPLLIAQVHKESGWRPGVVGRVGEIGWLQVYGSDWRRADGRRAYWRCAETTAILLHRPRLALRCGLRELAHWRASCPESGWWAAHKCGGCKEQVARSCPGRAAYVRAVRRRIARIAPLDTTGVAATP